MNQIMKELINSAKSSGKEKEVKINQSLQILSVTDDLTTFDPGSMEVAEFYALLYEFLIKSCPESEVVWNVVNVLQTVIRNPRACAALVHSYHFIHPLTLLLDPHLPSDRKFALLKIIQELSYGVVIQWQEAHLPKLMKFLLDILKSEERDLVPIALSVMVNVCHKNKPAIYCLMSSVDIKAFLRTVLNSRRDNAEICTLVCKLVMILDHLSGSVPDSEILSFVRVSFMRINSAFKIGNYLLMRHIVDFFRDAKESEHGRKVLLTYPKYEEETNQLIMTLSTKEVPNSWECVSQLVEFMQQLAELQLEVLLPLFPRLAISVLPWLKVPAVAPVILRLLSTQLRQTSHACDDIYNDLCNFLERNLEMLVIMLHSGCRQESRTSGEKDTLTQLLHLLGELALNANLTTAIAVAVDKEELKQLLIPLISYNNQESQLYQQPDIALYIEVLSFVNKLSMDDKEWLFLYSDLLQKKQILKALAVSLYSGSFEIKKTILFLAGTTSFSKESVTTLAKCLSELSHLFPVSADDKPVQSVTSQPSQLNLAPPLFLSSDRQALNALVDRLDHLLTTNQIQEASLASIIELYSYKLSEMRRMEWSLQSSLAAADSHRNHLQHRVSQLCSDTDRLHQLMYTSQQSLEASQLEVTELRTQLTAAQQSADSTQIKFKQLKQDVQSKSMIIKDQTEEISKMKRNIEELTKTNEETEQRVSVLTKQKSELDKTVQRQETTITALKLSNSQLEDKISLQEKENAEQKHLITNQQNQLLELERMRKVIFDITGGRKNL